MWMLLGISFIQAVTKALKYDGAHKASLSSRPAPVGSAQLYVCHVLPDWWILGLSPMVFLMSALDFSSLESRTRTPASLMSTAETEDGRLGVADPV
jgi:hypothetical protein